MDNVIGKIPEFTPNDGGEEEVKEVKPAEAEAEAQEKETPTDLPEEQKPVDDSEPSEASANNGQSPEIQGILSVREKLLKEIQELRSERRNLRTAETKEVITEVADKLDDLDQADINNIERVLKAKGYVTKSESQKIIYETSKDQALGEFLEKYPEYKPENDPNDINWTAFQRELSFYKMPSDPKLIKTVLEKAHKSIGGYATTSTTSKRLITAQKGGGGTQRSSSGKTLPPNLRRVYEDGGWSKEEIAEIESKL